MLCSSSSAPPVSVSWFRPGHCSPSAFLPLLLDELADELVIPSPPASLVRGIDRFQYALQTSDDLLQRERLSAGFDLLTLLVLHRGSPEAEIAHCFGRVVSLPLLRFELRRRDLAPAQFAGVDLDQGLDRVHRSGVGQVRVTVISADEREFYVLQHVLVFFYKRFCHLVLFGKSLGTHRFQRAVSAKDEFIGTRLGYASPQVMERLNLINRSFTETARWNRSVHRSSFYCFRASQRYIKAPEKIAM